VAGGKVYIDPVKQECKAFAPATVANLGPGFDWLGCAVEVRAQRRPCRRPPSAGPQRPHGPAPPRASTPDRGAPLPQGEGDTVSARVLPDEPGRVVIERIEGDNGRLSLVAEENCIGIAALETLRLMGQPSCGVALTLHKARCRGGQWRSARWGLTCGVAAS
jgi:homoserine kinase